MVVVRMILTFLFLYLSFCISQAYQKYDKILSEMDSHINDIYLLTSALCCTVTAYWKMQKYTFQNYAFRNIRCPIR